MATDPTPPVRATPRADRAARTAEHATAQADARRAAQARRLLAVFGDDLPRGADDERDIGEPVAPSRDEQLLAERPPHHDRH